MNPTQQISKDYRTSLLPFSLETQILEPLDFSPWCGIFLKAHLLHVANTLCFKSVGSRDH